MQRCSTYLEIQIISYSPTFYYHDSITLRSDLGYQVLYTAHEYVVFDTSVDLSLLDVKPALSDIHYLVYFVYSS